MSDSIIKLANITKMYGRSRGVVDINLEVPAGSIFGFLGPNGAGKTTTISMLIDLIHPSSGNIKIFGLDAQADSLKIRQRLGFLGAEITLDNGLTGWQQLEYFGNLRSNFDTKYVTELATKLNCDLSRKIRTLSHGNRQKIGLISALMHKPELLILDEPTSGLDPLVQDQFKQIIHEHKKQGKTVFISSHVLSEVEELCDQVAFVREGRLIASKPIDEITLGLARHVKFVSDDIKLPGHLEKLKGASHVKSKDHTTTCLYDGSADSLIAFAAKFKINDFSVMPPDLDLIFTKFYGG